MAELHATNHKYLMSMTATPPDGYWPVFKGESFDIWEPDRGVYYAWADPAKVCGALQEIRVRSARLERSAFAEFPGMWSQNPETLPCLAPRIAFRDVTRATDTRTVRVSLLPAHICHTLSAPEGGAYRVFAGRCAARIF